MLSYLLWVKKSGKLPDSKTIWKLRTTLIKIGLIKKVYTVILE